MQSAVERLLAKLSPELSRTQVERKRPDLLPLMRPWGQDWREYAGELGLACPVALQELGDAMSDVYIHVHDEHGWDLLTPKDSRENRRFLGELALEFPELAARAEMMPVFGQDGDLYLLAKDERVYAFTHDGWEDDGVAASTLEELLDILTRRSAPFELRELPESLRRWHALGHS